MAKDDDPPPHRSCGTMEVHEHLLRSDPEYAAARVDSERRAWECAHGARASERTGVTVIPVVVHVVWNTNAQNISDAQINSQIAVLNRDFRKTNTDVSNTPGVFQPLCADARIEFELAKTNPSGNTTSGIIRKKTTKTSFDQSNGVKASSSGGSDAWPADKYLNIWVCQLAGGLLGYAQFPGGPAATDGVVVRHSAFGDTGTAAAPFNRGRTATHEIGHWLNLRHIWGDDGNGCSGDDFVADTPNCAGANVGMPTFPRITCNNGPNGDLFVNYMDYTDDAGMVMFTHGQVNRMQACLDGDRSSIGYTKAGPTLAFVDANPTLMVLDMKPTVTVTDIQPTIAQLDFNPTAARLDIGPTLAFLDVKPTAAQLDTPPTIAQLDIQPTIAQLDYGGPTIAQADLGGIGPTIGTGDISITPIPIPYDPIPYPYPPQQGPMPFALATPHHTNAWIASHAALRDQQVESLAAEAQQIEQALVQMAHADAEGRLSATETATAEQLHAEYERILAELDELGAFAR